MNRRTKFCRAAVALSAILWPAAALAQAAAPPEPPLTVRLSLKITGLGSRAPDAPWLFPARNAATGLWRARVEPEWRPNERLSFDAAYEQRLQVFSSAALAPGGGVLGRATPPPYRLTPLDWELASGGHALWRHEIDRAAMHVTLPSVDITAGRQAVGWGRGVLFNAIDVFAPFAPLEADREWRRGVDALRADVAAGDRASVEAVGAFGPKPGESVYGMRLRGYNDRIDAEATGGWRAADRFAGASSSLAIRGAELHGEAAVFRTPVVAGSPFFDRRRTIAKAVLGASYQFAVGAGLLVDAEYHYSGFGAASADQMTALLADPEFMRRYQRGDTQILGRHAFAMTASYEWSALISSSAEWLQNPVDRSGLILASMTITPGDRGSLLLSAYVPFGRAPGAFSIRSEHGVTPLSVLAQFRFYR